MPKPPPTSGVMMRNLSGSTPNIGAIRPFTSQPPCVLAYIVQRPVAASNSAIDARASIDDTTIRLFTTVSRVTCAAWENSASVFARSPNSQSNTMFCFTSGHTSGTPLSVTCARSVIEGWMS